MKFTVSVDRVRTVFHASVGELDGAPPMHRLDIGLPLQNVSPDRMAAGLALIFHPWISGVLEVPEPISALPAGRIQEYFLPRRVVPGPIRGGDWPIPSARRTLLVAADGADHLPQGETDVLDLTSLPLREGFARGERRWTVSSNITMFTSPGGTGQRAWQQRLGLAVLLAADLQAKALLHRDVADTDRGVHRLLESVGLALGMP